MANSERITAECQQRCWNQGYTLIGQYVNMETPIAIQCPQHGVSNRLLKMIRKGKMCVACWRQRKAEFQSDCEFRVYRFFHLSQIPHVRQATIPGTRLSCDFFFPNEKLIIEIDGDQHWRYVRKWHRKRGDFQAQKDRDRQKTNWCLQNGFVLYRWCSDQVETFPQITEILRKSISSGKQHFLSNPERYPHLQ